MSLKESARRLFQARAGGGDPKKRVATQYIQQLGGSVQKMASNVAASQEEFKQDWAKKRQSTLDQTKGDPEARAKLAEQLDAMKREYDVAVRKSTGPFRGREAKQEGANEIAGINSRIQAFQDDFKAMDGILAQQGTPSEANTIGANADNAFAYSPLSNKDFDYREDGIYVTQPSTGEKVRLSDYEAPIMRDDVGIAQANAGLLDASSKAMSNQSEEYVSGKLSGDAATLIKRPNFKSLIFDDIEGFNFAKDFLAPSGDVTLNDLKEDYDKDPTFRAAVQDSWKRAYVNAGLEKWQENQEVEEVRGGEVKKERTYPVYNYNKQGTYLGSSQQTAEDVRSMFDIDNGDFSFGKSNIAVATNKRGEKTWSVRDITGTQASGQVFNNLEDVLDQFAPYAARKTTNDPFNPNN